MGLLDKAKELLNKHDDKVDQGLDKASEMAKTRMPGHDEQIDQGVDQLQRMTGEGDTTQQQAPGEAAPGGPQPGESAGPGQEPPPQR